MIAVNMECLYVLLLEGFDALLLTSIFSDSLIYFFRLCKYSPNVICPLLRQPLDYYSIEFLKLFMSLFPYLCFPTRFHFMQTLIYGLTRIAEDLPFVMPTVPALNAILYSIVYHTKTEKTPIYCPHVTISHKTKPNCQSYFAMTPGKQAISA